MLNISRPIQIFRFTEDPPGMHHLSPFHHRAGAGSMVQVQVQGKQRRYSFFGCSNYSRCKTTFKMTKSM